MTDVSAAAAALGRAGGLKRKNYSPEERERRRSRFEEAKKHRWPAKAKTPAEPET